MDESTIVAFTSDHGYHLGEHGWWQKTTLFEESARGPLILAGPGVTEDRSTTALAELVDLYPTLAGLEVPDWVAGTSLVPALENPKASVKEAALTQLGTDSFSIRTDRFRYTEWQGGEGGAELYDHRNDPDEFHNLAGDPDHRDTVERLTSTIDDGDGGTDTAAVDVDVTEVIRCNSMRRKRIRGSAWLGPGLAACGISKNFEFGRENLSICAAFYGYYCRGP